MLMWMIGKLGRDQKADWYKHLPCLPVDFYFPTFVSTEKHQCVNHYIADLCQQQHVAFKEVQVQSISEAERWR